MFASLSIPNYRIYFSGTLLTNMGQWMARTAQSWLVLVILTHGNAAVLGWVMAVNFAPACSALASVACSSPPWESAG